MPDAGDDVSIRIRLQNALKFERDAKRSARAIDDIGDEASQAARKMARFNAASTKTRVNFGPFSTSMRGGALAVGAFTLATGKAVPAALGLAEATATVIGGGGAAGGVGLLALAQGAGVAQLGIKGLTDALGGNQTALKGLTPEMRSFFDTLHAKQQRLQRTAGSSMLPGLSAGAQSASRNFGILNRLVGRTGRTLGGLGQDAGTLLGSAGFGADLRTVGNANVRIIDDLGHGAIFLADGFRHVAVEAAPLAEWLAEEARQGAQLTDVWLENARATGKLSRFFRDARTDLTLLGSAGGHTGRGLINLFGAQDVDGTQTLRSLDRLTGRFERWTRLASTQRNVGDAIVAEIPKAVGAVMTAIAHNLPDAGATAARVFLHSFMEADVWGKLLAGGFLAKKLGVFGAAKGLAGRAGGPLAGLGAKGGSPANPMWVAVVNDIPGGGGVPVPAGGTRGGTKAMRLLRRGGRVLGPLGAAITIGELAQGALPAHNLPTSGPGGSSPSNPAGHVPFVQNPFGRVPDAAQTHVTVPVILNDREIARAHAQTISRLGARKR